MVSLVRSYGDKPYVCFIIFIQVETRYKFFFSFYSYIISGLEPTMDAIGPLAASVFDVALLLEVIAGHDEERDHRQSSHAMDPPQYSKLVFIQVE